MWYNVSSWFILMISPSLEQWLRLGGGNPNIMCFPHNLIRWAWWDNALETVLRRSVHLQLCWSMLNYSAYILQGVE